MRFLAIFLILISSSTHALMTEGGRGMLFGGDHAFSVTAKTGWILDNESAVGQGLHMVFYPNGETWEQNSVLIYGRSISTKSASSPKLQVEQTVREFRNNGSPNYSSEALTALTLPNGQKAELYYFSGDQWGNHEAAAYIQERNTINYLVFNALTKETFDQYIEDFREIVSTYKNLYTPPVSLTTEKFESLKLESESMLREPLGQKYESIAIKAVGQSMAYKIGDCTSYFDNDELQAFRYFARIDKDGKIHDTYIFPTHALSVCFRALMSNESYPIHDFESFVLDIDMKFSP